MIEDLAALAEEFSVEPQLLGAMIHKTPSFYRQFTIPKRTGGVRRVDAPNGQLLKVQRHLARAFFSAAPVHSASHGYTENRSIVSNASQHIGSRCLLKLDLKDFFPSIKFGTVRQIVGILADHLEFCTPEVGYYITRLCTLYGALPQGSATSPVISNTVMYQVDRRLEAICQPAELHYTRYADDLCFSGERISRETIRDIKQLIGSSCFSINPKKVRLIQGHNSKKVVTGIVVNNETLRLPKAQRRRFRAELHQFQTLHANGSADAMARQASLLGKFQHWRFVEPDNTYASEAVSYLRSF